MTTLCIATGYNSPRKRDASCVFIPESAAFKTIHAGESGVECPRLVLEHPTRASQRRATVEDAIRKFDGLDTLAVFGRGTPAKLIATGWDMREKVETAKAAENVGR